MPEGVDHILVVHDGSAASRRALIDAAAIADQHAARLTAARVILGERDPEPRFEIVSGAGPSGVRRAVAQLGCDLVLVPARGIFHGRLARQVRRRVTAEVLGVRAA